MFCVCVCVGVSSFAQYVVLVNTRVSVEGWGTLRLSPTATPYCPPRLCYVARAVIGVSTGVVVLIANAVVGVVIAVVAVVGAVVDAVGVGDDVAVIAVDVGVVGVGFDDDGDDVVVSRIFLPFR